MSSKDAPTPPASPIAIDQQVTVRVVERAVILLLLALLLVGVLRVLQPFTIAILFGGFLAIGTWPLRKWLVGRGVPRLAAAGLLLVALVLLVALPAVVLAPGLSGQIRFGSSLAREWLAHAPESPPDWVRNMPLAGERAGALWPQMREAQINVRELLAPYAGTISETLIGLASGVVSSLVQILLALVVATALWAHGEKEAASLRDIAFRLGGPTAAAALDAAGGAVKGVAWGVVGTAVLQGVLLGIGLSIAGIPGATSLGFLGFVFSLSQVLGPLVILTWVGAAWWLYTSGTVGWAVFMLLWGIVLVSGSDSVVRPLLISRSVAMPMTLIILGVFGGLIAFGFLGMFVGPALLAVGHALLQSWRRLHPTIAVG
jgi:predicted PurR-regulated permease PerM